jgi:hypothetical protein
MVRRKRTAGPELATSPAQADATTSPPTRIGQYQLERKIGEGGMGSCPLLATIAGTTDSTARLRPQQLFREAEGPALLGVLDS